MPKHEEIENKTLAAENLLKLVRHHKKTCTGECGISLYPLFPVYRKLAGEGAIKELEDFV